MESKYAFFICHFESQLLLLYLCLLFLLLLLIAIISSCSGSIIKQPIGTEFSVYVKKSPFDMLFIYLFFYLFIFSFIYLFIYLFIINKSI